jgi:MFS family permease
MAITIAGDIYTLKERAKAQGYLASVWAISSVVGPTLGGVFSSLGIWRGIFFVNVPLCLIAVFMLLRAFHEKIEKRRHRVDYLGAGLLTVALTLLIVAVLEGGQAWAWSSVQSIGAFALGAIVLAVFLVVERRAAEPVLPPWVFSRRLLLTTSLISFGVGALILGLTSYVPTYLEGAGGASPILAGLALAALTLGWPVSASQSGRLYLRVGFRSTVLIGITITVIGAILLVVVAPLVSVVLVAVVCFVIGLGMGLVATPSLIAAQSSVEWNERGVVTGTNLFSRSIGSALGVAVFGAIANSIYAGTAGGDRVPHVIVSASTAVYVAVVVTAALVVLAVLAMPRVRSAAGAPVATGPVPAAD